MKNMVFAKYRQVRDPDLDKTAELLLKAKGLKRTMAEFADVCGVSASTLSRIYNKKNKKRCSDLLLEKIFYNADPDCGIQWEDLMAAQGMVPELRNGRERRYEKNDYEEEIRNIIIGTIIDRGFSVKEDKKTAYNALNYSYEPDLSIWTEAIDGKNNLLWHFEYWSLAYIDEPGAGDQWNQLKRIRQKILMILGMKSLEMVDALKNDKMTFVITERVIYERLLDSLKDVELNTRISIMLINLSSNEMEDEIELPVKGITSSIKLKDVDKIERRTKDSKMKFAEIINS